MRKRLPLACISIVLAVLVSGPLKAQKSKSQTEAKKEYRIGVGDELSITFWQNPRYNTVARVSAAGEIEIPLVGSIKVEGLTTRELRERIISRISLFDMNITQVAVTVTKYSSKNVYVTGSVLKPGKYTFEVIPNLWQIISEAGGPLQTANLSDVVIVRSSPQGENNLIHVDLTQALETGNFQILPRIRPGDTIHIRGSMPGTAPMMSSPLERKNIVLVFGDVARPGAYNLEKDMDLLDALVLAGGPAPTANLRKVRLYYRGERHAEMAQIDVKRYLEKSIPIPLELHPGDAIYVPARRSFSPVFMEVLRIGLTALTSYIIFRTARRF